MIGKETRGQKILIVAWVTVLAILIMGYLSFTSAATQAIEATSEQLIKVYETELPYECLSDEARKSIRACFVDRVYKYGNDCNTIEDFFRLAFADDTEFNKVVLLVAYLNLRTSQLIFFYIYEDWFVREWDRIKLAV